MKAINMTKVLLATVLIVAVTSWQSGALASELNVQIDKGSVIVERAAILGDYEINVDAVPECLAQVQVREATRGIEILHTPAPCQRGATITLRINASLNASIVLRAGTMRLLNAQRTLRGLSRMSAVVDAGTIQTSISGISLTRTSNYAGAEATFQPSERQPLPYLTLRVQAGMIHL